MSLLRGTNLLNTMSETLQKGEFLLIDSEVYQVVGDYSNVHTELDYDIENINNPEDNMVVSQKDAREMLGNKWQKIEIPT